MIPMQKSETIAYTTAGDTRSYALERWLGDPRGPRGGIVVIDGFHLEATLNLTTAGGVTLPGADQANLVKEIEIYDNTGLRRKLTGFKTRTMMHYELGNRTPADPTTFAAATTADATYHYIIPFTGRYAFRGLDFGIPVHSIIGGAGRVSLTFPSSAQLLGSGGNPTINSGSYKLTAILRELPRDDKQVFARDVWEWHSQTSNTDLTVFPKGRILAAAIAVKEAASGGSSMANMLSFTQQSLKYSAISRAALKQAYLMNRSTVSGQDPFFNDRAIPLLCGRSDAQIEDFPILGGELNLQVDSSVTTPDVVCKYIAQKDMAQLRQDAARMKVSPNARLRVKTKGKTRQDPAAWGDYAAFMPGKWDE